MAKIKVKKVEDNIYNPKVDAPKEYIFENVFKLKNNEWTSVMSGEQLGKMWLSKEILYSTEFQRGVKLERNSDGELVEKAVCSRKNIKDIKTSIAKGDYSPDEITLNILDKDCKIELDNRTMYVEGLLFILDGQHRAKSLAELVNSNEVLGFDKAGISDKYFNVKIVNYSSEKAAEVFSQFTKGLKISKSLAESYNKKNATNRIVSDLNKSSVLQDKIDVVRISIVKTDMAHLTTFSTLTSAIKDSYGEISDDKMEEDVLAFLKIFFEELVSVFPEMINDNERQLSKQHTLVAENFMMYCWVELSQLLYCKRFNSSWKEELANIKNVDFYKLDDKDLNPIWSSILRLTGTGSVSIVNNSSTRQTARRIIKEQFYMAQN